MRVQQRIKGSVYEARSQSRPGLTHLVQRTPRGWVCSCEGYAYHGICYHLGAVERRAEREGWPFGRIAYDAARAA